MGLGQIKALANFYRPMLGRWRSGFDFDQRVHVYDMCSKIQDFTDEAKANRWLGFIQGVLWTHNIRDLEELKRDNHQPI